MGNVRAVVSDVKIPEVNGGAITNLTADVVSATDYYPFGMQMPGRVYKPTYRYGFNGMEKDDEVKGEGNSYDFGARMHDPRLGRFLSIDPLARKFTALTPYAFAANSPIGLVDYNGEGPVYKSKTGASKIVDDLNRLYKATYGADNAFKVVPYITVIDNKKVAGFTIKTSNNFDWLTDRYTSKLFDGINMKHEYMVDVGDVKNPANDKLLTYRDGKGGGYTISSSNIVVSSALEKYGDEDTQIVRNWEKVDGKQIHWTYSMVFMHELLFHILDYTDQNNPNVMREFYKSRLGDEDHVNDLGVKGEHYKIPETEAGELLNRKEQISKNLSEKKKTNEDDK